MVSHLWEHKGSKEEDIVDIPVRSRHGSLWWLQAKSVDWGAPWRSFPFAIEWDIVDFLLNKIDWVLHLPVRNMAQQARCKLQDPRNVDVNWGWYVFGQETVINALWNPEWHPLGSITILQPTVARRHTFLPQPASEHHHKYQHDRGEQPVDVLDARHDHGTNLCLLLPSIHDD